MAKIIKKETPVTPEKVEVSPLKEWDEELAIFIAHCRSMQSRIESKTLRNQFKINKAQAKLQVLKMEHQRVKGALDRMMKKHNKP